MAIVDAVLAAEGSTGQSVRVAVLWVAVAGGLGGITAYLRTSGLRNRITLMDGVKEQGVIATTVIGATSAVAAWIALDGHASLTWFGEVDSALDLGSLLAAYGVGLGGGKAAAETVKGKVVAAAGAKAALEAPNPALAATMATGNLNKIHQALP